MAIKAGMTVPVAKHRIVCGTTNFAIPDGYGLLATGLFPSNGWFACDTRSEKP